ncbi:MAG: HNH endonuclease signature motif containing protein [Clostridia bacterium]|nr:HNH endonuclease signature motif containing protein [Clostridia bacterium]MDD3862598.1 HNH endonuclease signature motif containing protein [Clostridia bacterium]
MINKILNLLSDVSLAKKTGRFLSDKSYAYDDIFFISKYILETADAENIFNKSTEIKRVDEYIKDIFQLRGKGSGSTNYLTEALNLLTYSNVLHKLDSNKFKILNIDILKFITEKIENSYIFLYTVVYKTFFNDNLIETYKEFINAKEEKEKKLALLKLLQEFKSKSISIGGRYDKKETNWSKQLVKYASNVLSFANEGEYIARTLNLSKDKKTSTFKLVDINDISINIEGTRTNANSKKINDYVYKFDKKYVQKELNEILFKNFNLDNYSMSETSHIAEDLASLKIEKIIKETNKEEYISKYEQNQFIERITKSRNNNIQRTFKDGLLKNNSHKCPICGFEYEDFLIASHIKPYAKCDDTYDAINNYNGFLLCPNHDKLII